ncbi:MAG: PDZ domain-containing protein [candidate division Zixibacteria bacterium]|nr:serine protease [candidate division Zixibacteria bacterium]NIX59012.1 PDZ domain-containing protein [candidate division Zixibacteria bacterium]
MLCIFLGLLIPADAAGQRLKSLENEYASIYQSARHYAVTISVSSVPTGRNTYFPPSRRGGYETAIGSGFIYDSLGHIVTSSSVTEQGNLFKITFADGTSRYADLLGVDLENDVAVLKVGQPPYAAPRFADSDKLVPGHWVGLVGNSFGIFPSFAYGIAAGRNNNDDILVTADLSPGCAGGVVVNSDVKVVGMIAYKLTEPVSLGDLNFSDRTELKEKSLLLMDSEIEFPVGGYSLMIPSNKIVQAAQGIITGRVNHGAFLGIIPEDLDIKWAKRVFNINYGVYITEVQENSPAYRAGIREGDILLRFGWHRILNSEQLRKLILNSKPESTIEIKILRAGKTRMLTAKLGYAYQAGGEAGLRSGYVAPSKRQADTSSKSHHSGEDTIR